MRRTLLAIIVTAGAFALLIYVALLPQPLVTFNGVLAVLAAYLAVYAGAGFAAQRLRAVRAAPAARPVQTEPVMDMPAPRPEPAHQPAAEPIAAPALQRFDDGSALVDIGGTAFRIRADANYLGQFAHGFEPEMVRLFRAVATGSRTVLDVGANVGCTALLFSGMADTVHAFEPSPRTSRLLRLNVERAGRGNIVIHEIGAGDTPGPTQLVVAPQNLAGSFVGSLSQVSDGHEVETIRIRTLDEVVAEQGLRDIDFLKVDTEGFEAHVLRGAAATLQAWRPAAVLELNHWCLNVFQRMSVPDFLDVLRGIFPILLAVDPVDYLDLHDRDQSYHAMYHHILHGRYASVLGAFEEGQLAGFRAGYRRWQP